MAFTFTREKPGSKQGLIVIGNADCSAAMVVTNQMRHKFSWSTFNDPYKAFRAMLEGLPASCMFCCGGENDSTIELKNNWFTVGCGHPELMFGRSTDFKVDYDANKVEISKLLQFLLDGPHATSDSDDSDEDE
jgi:hypothetical protein